MMSVTIADPNWRNAVSVPVSGPSASWQVSTIGRFSGVIPAGRAHGLGFDDLKGKGIRYDDPYMGPWGGTIQRNQTDSGSGIMELSADSFHARMRGIRTPIMSKTISGASGQLALYVMTQSPTDKRLWFDSIAASSDGAVQRLDLRGDDLYDVVSSLASDSDHEFNVILNDDGTIDWEFRRRIGSDNTGSVILSEGWNVMSCQVSPSIDGMVNDILAVSNEQDWITAPRRRIIDPDSVIAYEHQSEIRQYLGNAGTGSMVTRAKRDLEINGIAAIPATVSMPGNRVELRSIREGDTVRLWSNRQNARYFFRVISRSIERSGGNAVAKLAGDCILEETMP